MSEPARLKITSDGTVPGTNILVTDATGEHRLEHVTRVEWRADTNNPLVTAIITVRNVPLETEAKGRILTQEEGMSTSGRPRS